MHVDGAGLMLCDSVVGESNCGGVIDDSWCGWLGMYEFFKWGGRFFGVVEKSTELCFGSRGEDNFYDNSEIKDGAVEDVGIHFVSKVEVASLSAAGSSYS